MRFCFLVLFFASAYSAPSTKWDCKTDDVSLCWGVRAVTFMNRLARMDNVAIVDGVSFVSNGEVDRSGRALSEDEVENGLPEDYSQKTARLFDLFVDAALKFFKTHSLQLKFPENVDFQRALDEGRGKLKKTALPIILGIAAKIFTIIPLILGGLALIAVKALFFAKIAFAVVAVIVLQKILGAGAIGAAGIGSAGLSKGPAVASGGWSSGGSYGGGSSSYSPGWSSASGGGPYYRSFNEKDAQDLAYSAQAPEN